MAYRGRTLDTVTQVEVLKSFHEVREEPWTASRAAGRMVATVRALSGGDDADRRVFNLLYRGLEAVEERGSGYESLEAAFSLKLSTLAGYEPQLDSCMICERDAAAEGGHPYFAPALGGVLCAECRPRVRGSVRTAAGHGRELEAFDPPAPCARRT